MHTRDRLAAARLYLCTDARREHGDLAEFAEAALAGGVEVIQLRDKGSAGEREHGPLEALGELANKFSITAETSPPQTPL